MSHSLQNNKKYGNKVAKKNKNKNNSSIRPIKVFDHAGLIPSLSTPENRIYTVVQNIDTTYYLTQAALTESTLGFNFKLSDVAQYTSFQTLFDQYRIDEVQMIIRPTGQAQYIVGYANQKIPLLYTVLDYDDNTSPTGVSQLKEYANCQVSLYETVCVRFVPHAATAAYSGAFTSFANVRPPWIDIAYPSILHYGVKMACEAGLSGQTALQYWDISVKYRISFRNVR